MTQQWKPIESAPKTGRTLLLGYWNSLGKWRTVRGQWMSAECIASSWEEPDDIEAGWFETAVEAEDVPNCWPIDPTHWMPLPDAPCQTCNDQGAVGNVLTAQPCPDCTPPASAQDDAKDERTKVMEIIAGVWDHGTQIDDAADEVIELLRSNAPAAGDAPEDLLHRLANPLTPYGLLARALRVATGTTLMDMARATGNTAAEISSIEFGRKEPDEGWFERAALFFASTSRGIVVPPSALKAAHARRAASQQQEG
ncbi:hypothetical protein AXY46_03530 [Achromobacter xylosoxidans]|nr:hypothetical protein AXY46_03530 [Achromobacter xylosoxidans]